MTARAKAVAVVAEALDDLLLSMDRDAAELLAEAVVAALETGMGLTEEEDVDWCDAEDLIPAYDDPDYWGKCNQPADHKGDHEHVDGHTWRRTSYEPPEPRRTRLTTRWTPTEETT